MNKNKIELSYIYILPHFVMFLFNIKNKIWIIIIFWLIIFIDIHKYSPVNWGNCDYVVIVQNKYYANYTASPYHYLVKIDQFIINSFESKIIVFISKMAK